MNEQAIASDYKKIRLITLSLRFFSKILSLSRIVRRIHSIPEEIWMIVFHVFQMYLKNPNAEYFIVDSFPIRAYENHKSFRAKIFKGKSYHGYSASKKSFFFGLKVHMIIDKAWYSYGVLYNTWQHRRYRRIKIIVL